MIQRLRPRIQRAVDALLDEAAGKSEMEFMAEFANPLPVRVIAEMLGIPGEDQRDFQIWSEDLANFFGNAVATLETAHRAQDSLVNLTEYFRALLPERREHKGDDLVSLLLRVEEEGKVLTGEELLAQCSLLLVAGHETTRNLIGNGLFALLQHPDQFAKLKKNPSLINLAVRELARSVGFGYHDPEKFSNPEVLDLARDEGMPLSFGHGIHFCIGASLAYAEAEIAFSSLLERTTDLRMRDDVPAWRPNPGFRGLSRLPLALSMR